MKLTLIMPVSQSPSQSKYMLQLATETDATANTMHLLTVSKTRVEDS